MAIVSILFHRRHRSDVACYYSNIETVVTISLCKHIQPGYNHFLILVIANEKRREGKA